MSAPEAECLICGSRDYRDLHPLGAGVRLVLCAGCDVARTCPYPVEAPNEVRGTDAYLGEGALYRRLARRMLRFVMQVRPPPGDLLDVGCSVGYFVEEAARAGYRARGVDANPDSVAAARGRGLHVQLSRGLEGVAPGSVDVITMSHTLEHISDIPGALASLRVALREPGLVVFSQPNYRSLMADWQKASWYGWQSDQHFWHFTTGSLGRVIAGHGFRVVKTENTAMHYAWPPLRLAVHPRTYLRRLHVALLARIAPLLQRGDAFNLAGERVP